jgi:hypothetical protein
MSRRSTIAALLFGLAAGFVCSCSSGPIQAVGLDPGALTTGVVAHWRFDDGSGTGVADSSGNHDGTISGSTWSWTTKGHFGGALHLEQGDFVSVDNFPDATSSWTVAAWVQIPSQMVGGDVDATLISTEAVFKGGWEMLVTKSKYQFGFWTGPTLYDYAYAECSQCIRPDQWQHLAAAVDGKAMTLTLYLDGNPQPRKSIPRPISPGVPTLYMGRWATTSPARLLIGSLDDVAIWNRALSSAEIALLVEGPAP